MRCQLIATNLETLDKFVHILVNATLKYLFRVKNNKGKVNNNPILVFGIIGGHYGYCE